MRTKYESWKKFVTECGNTKPWGFVYKQQTNKLKIEKVIRVNTLRRGEHMTKRKRHNVCWIHIPNDLSHEDTQEQGVIKSLARIASDAIDAPFFTGKEMAIAVKTFKNDKAPGMDLIEVKVLSNS